MVGLGRMLTVAIFLPGAGIFVGEEIVTAQVYCYQCTDDPELYEYTMSVQPPPWGWYAHPCGLHFWPVTGACFFEHAAGCFHYDDASPEDGNLLQQLARSEGDVFRNLVKNRSEDLLVLEDLGLVGVRGCGDGIAYWMPLRESQIRALAG